MTEDNKTYPRIMWRNDYGIIERVKVVSETKCFAIIEIPDRWNKSGVVERRIRNGNLYASFDELKQHMIDNAKLNLKDSQNRVLTAERRLAECVALREPQP